MAINKNTDAQIRDANLIKESINDTEVKLVDLKSRLHRTRIISNYFLPVGIARNFEITGDDDDGMYYAKGFVNFINWHALVAITVRIDENMHRDRGRILFEKLFERRWVVIPLTNLKEDIAFIDGDVYTEENVKNSHPTFSDAWCDFISRAPAPNAPNKMIELWQLYRELVEFWNIYPCMYLEYISKMLFSVDVDVDTEIAMCRDYIVGLKLGVDQGAMQKVWRQTDMLAGEHAVYLLNEWRKLVTMVARADDEECSRLKRKHHIIETNLNTFGIYDISATLEKAYDTGIIVRR